LGKNSWHAVQPSSGRGRNPFPVCSLLRVPPKHPVPAWVTIVTGSSGFRAPIPASRRPEGRVLGLA
jgi:hypothetical protein